MKSLLLAGLLLAASPAWAQQSYKGPEVLTPVKWGQCIILHSTDSAAVAYVKTKQAILASGYGLDKTDKEALFLSTPFKPLDASVSMSLQVVVVSAASGSTVTIRGVYTWLSAATIMAHLENRQLPVQYIGKGDAPTQRAWVAMQRVAVAALPAATLGYK